MCNKVFFPRTSCYVLAGHNFQFRLCRYLAGLSLPAGKPTSLARVVVGVLATLMKPRSGRRIRSRTSELSGTPDSKANLVPLFRIVLCAFGSSCVCTAGIMFGIMFGTASIMFDIAGIGWYC